MRSCTRCKFTIISPQFAAKTLVDAALLIETGVGPLRSLGYSLARYPLQDPFGVPRAGVVAHDVVLTKNEM